MVNNRRRKERRSKQQLHSLTYIDQVHVEALQGRITLEVHSGSLDSSWTECLVHS